MEALSQLLLRNAETLQSSGSLLWINPPADSAWAELDPVQAFLQLHCQDHGDWQRLQQAGAQVNFGAFPDREAAPEPAGIILTLPREKARLDMLTHLAVDLFPDNGVLYVVGENRTGIKSSPGVLRKHFDRVDKLDYARHCTLIRAVEPKAAQPFKASDYRQTWHITDHGTQIRVCSWPGVFAHGELDAGTQLLLDHLPDLPGGATVLDFACGAGVIAATLLQRNPAIHCTLSDNSALACLAAEASLAANGMTAKVVAGDGLAGIEGRFDMIVSNPPFHTRHKSNIRLSPELLAPVRNFLNPGGQLLLVANRHLPYGRWLDEVFGHYETVTANQRFQVLKAIHDPR